MSDILIEQLGAVSMRNGMVRVQTQAVGADGELRTTGELVIPANVYGQVVGSLQNAGQQLQARIQEAQQGQSEEQAG